jgi:hypothetical protein
VHICCAQLYAKRLGLGSRVLPSPAAVPKLSGTHAENANPSPMYALRLAMEYLSTQTPHTQHTGLRSAGAVPRVLNCAGVKLTASARLQR